MQITIQPAWNTSADLERQLERRFSLQEALVVETAEYDDHDRVAPALGAAGADYLLRVVSDGDSIAISWGSTLRAVVDALPRLGKPLQNVRVIQALGGLGNPNTEIHASDLTRRMARIFAAEAVLLPAPGVVRTAAAHEALLEDFYVAQALAAARKANIAVMSLGVPRQDSVLMREGQIVSWPELTRLREQGAVGDINLRYFDGQGQADPFRPGRAHHQPDDRGNPPHRSGGRHCRRAAQIQSHRRRIARANSRRAHHRFDDRETPLENKGDANTRNQPRNLNPLAAVPT